MTTITLAEYKQRLAEQPEPPAPKPYAVWRHAQFGMHWHDNGWDKVMTLVRRSPFGDDRIGLVSVEDYYDDFYRKKVAEDRE